MQIASTHSLVGRLECRKYRSAELQFFVTWSVFPSISIGAVSLGSPPRTTELEKSGFLSKETSWRRAWIVLGKSLDGSSSSAGIFRRHGVNARWYENRLPCTIAAKSFPRTQIFSVHTRFYFSFLPSCSFSFLGPISKVAGAPTIQGQSSRPQPRHQVAHPRLRLKRRLLRS
jgi:hypothetical protein